MFHYISSKYPVITTFTYPVEQTKHLWLWKYDLAKGVGKEEIGCESLYWDKLKMNLIL